MEGEEGAGRAAEAEGSCGCSCVEDTGVAGNVEVGNSVKKLSIILFLLSYPYKNWKLRLMRGPTFLIKITLTLISKLSI